MNRSSKSAIAATLALALSAPAARANGPFINEIYASHTGTDNMEYIELIGTPGASLDGVMVLIVEGQVSSTEGVLDRAWDLSGNTIPLDGYFVLGDTAVVNQEFGIGASDTIENGSETFYVIRTSDTAAISALLGTDIDPDLDLVTSIPSMASILDIIGMVDAAAFAIYDGAGILGPDGTFFPAGVYRGGDFPNAWCSTQWLDFSNPANTTPGAVNGACAGETTIYCTAGTSASGCTANIWTAGVSSATAATGFHLIAGCLEGGKDGIFFWGANGQQGNPWGTSSSFKCVVPPVSRGGLLTGTGTVGACDGLFQQDLNARWTAKPAQNPGMGAVVQAQLWYRDPMSTSNQTTAFSNACEFTVAP